MDFAATGALTPIPLEGARSLDALIANLFLLQGLRASALSWNYPTWSISIEFMAYLAFPFVLPWILRAGHSGKLAFAAFLAAALLWLAYLTHGNFDQWDGPLALIRCVPEFLLGTLLYDVVRTRTGTFHSLPAIAVLAVLLTLAAAVHMNAPDFVVVLLFAVLIPVAAVSRGVATDLLNSRPLTWLGNISYSLYLIHGLVEFVATILLARALGIVDPKDLPAGRAFVLMAVMLGVSLILAYYSYCYIEKTGRRYLRDALGVRA
jgi:peptidoglycan/LPS O-acetylase OafA/YrhL